MVAATPETLALLAAYDWPGNVRQLENAVYRAIVLADAPYLQPHDFPAISGRQRAAAGGAPADDAARRRPPPAARRWPRRPPTRRCASSTTRGHLRTLEEIERDLIQLAIEIYAGHMTEVARRLGIGRSTLYRKVREQGLEELVAQKG